MDDDLRSIEKSAEKVKPCKDYNKEIGDVVAQYAVSLNDLKGQINEMYDFAPLGEIRQAKHKQSSPEKGK